jgi:hypothetical protein
MAYTATDLLTYLLHDRPLSGLEASISVTMLQLVLESL